MTTNYPFYHIPKPELGARRIVISDIHGCIKTFEALLKKIALQPNDQLFLLGDFIHKGKESKAVLDKIIDLISDGYHIFPLRGNHEEIFLEYASISNPQVKKWHTKKHKTQDLFDEQGSVIPKYYNFISKLPYYYQLDKFYLVHAGFDFEEEKPFEAYHKMTWVQNFRVDSALVGNKQIIYGHTPTRLTKIEKRIERKYPKIPLDNGCVTKKMDAEQGTLLALNLDTMQLMKQENIDFKWMPKTNKVTQIAKNHTGLKISRVIFQRILFSLKIKWV